MHIILATNLACPLDGLPLHIGAKQVTCAHGHSFDIARQGYINLLPVQHKRSKHPGDSQEMVLARSGLLNSGVYASIADKLNSITLDLIAGESGHELCMLDAGCGEGYYLARMQRALQESAIQKQLALIGLDISKPAIVAAAKRSKAITWLIASSKQPPLLPASVDLIFCLFGFPMYDSFKTLLKPGGQIILVEAGPMHLLELRKIIYPSITQTPPPDVSKAEAVGFRLREEHQLSYVCTLTSNAQIMNLLQMTPHYFRASYEGKQAASELETIDITVDVVFRVIQC